MEEKIVLKVPSHIGKIETMEDKGLKLSVYTQELDPTDEANLFRLKQKLGWFIFSEAKIEPEDLVDLPEIKGEFKSDKTPSQRLRAVLYVFWQQSGSKGNYDDFYKDYIEKVITKIKEQINP